MVGYSPWGHKESDTIERLHFHVRFHRLRVQSHKTTSTSGASHKWGLQATSTSAWMVVNAEVLQLPPTVLAVAAAKSLQSCSTLCDAHRRQPTRLPRTWDSPGKNTGVGCHFLLQCMKVKSESEVAQSCPTLSDPMDCSPLGSSVHGIFQARVLEWVAIAFSAPLC